MLDLLHWALQAIGVALPQLANRAARAAAARRRRTRAYRDLASLDAYMLRDIGLSHRAAAESLHPPQTG